MKPPPEEIRRIGRALDQAVVDYPVPMADLLDADDAELRRYALERVDAILKRLGHQARDFEPEELNEGVELVIETFRLARAKARRWMQAVAEFVAWKAVIEELTEVEALARELPKAITAANHARECCLHPGIRGADRPGPSDAVNQTRREIEAQTRVWLADLGAARELLAEQERANRPPELPAAPAPAPPGCAVCGRTRYVFDADGVGYCKRHAAERGLHRPGRVDPPPPSRKRRARSG